jgi:hypothetical protein
MFVFAIFQPGCVGFTYHKWYMQCSLLSAVTSTSTDPYFMSAVLADGCGGFVGILIFVFLFEQKRKKYFSNYHTDGTS